VIVPEKAANVVENEAARQVTDTFPEQPVKTCRGAEPRLFIPRHDVGKVGGSIQHLDILPVVSDRNPQVDAVALQHRDLVLPRAELSGEVMPSSMSMGTSTTKLSESSRR